ncbi:hypothetical protein ACHAWF_001140 [Thalassiosira exigua]
MSRAFTPPDTLSEDDIRTVADVRRAVWTNGIFGLGAGSTAGMAGHLLLQTLQKKYVGDHAGEATARATAGKIQNSGFIYKCLHSLPPLGRNTFMLSMLGGGAFGSFLMSTNAGNNAVHMLHPIFNLGRDENAGKSPYQIAMSKAQKEGDSDATTMSAEDIEDQLDAAHHRTRSLQRKASMKRRLETGRSLSDTHGNTWPHNELGEETEEVQKEKSMHRAEVWGRRQTQRRQTVQDRIEKGGALSNSTGGHWTKDSNGGGDA